MEESTNTDSQEIYTSDGRCFSRIYHSHIRKCAGTSFNFKFIGNSCDHDLSQIQKIYSSAAASNGQASHNGKVFVGWNAKLINSGNYFYAWSHIPFHKLNLPSETFILTTLRDPVERVMSHYRMIYGYYKNQVNHPCMRTEGKWLGDSRTIIEFIDNMPKEHLMAQLYHYSESFSVEEALDALSNVNFISNVEDLNTTGYTALENIIPFIKLPPGKVRQNSTASMNISDEEKNYLKCKLIAEYKFYDLSQNLIQQKLMI